MAFKNQKTSQKIADRLKQLRKEKEITQSELANDIEVSRATVVGYESGSVMPSTDTLIKIANIYKVSMDWLCGLNDNMYGNKLVTFADAIVDIIGLLTSLDGVVKTDGDDRVNITFFNRPVVKALAEYAEINESACTENLKRKIVDLWVADIVKESGYTRVGV